MKYLILILVFCLGSLSASAEIFGDGNLANGIEDSRVSLAGSRTAMYQRFVGTVMCKNRIRGTAILLRMSQSDSGFARPLLFTARHVLPESDEELLFPCTYHPAASRWNSLPIPENMRVQQTNGQDNESTQRSVINQFSRDWVAIGMDTWPNWKNYAIPISLEMGGQEGVSAIEASKAFFIGYDALENRFMVDGDCEFGPLDEDSFFSGSSGLVWDDCDSVGGSSGGALIVLSDGTPKIAGIRIGNLFDIDRHPDGPRSGDQFDLNANINVSRLVDEDILRSIRTLLILNPSE